jgi:hypothetical protein
MQFPEPSLMFDFLFLIDVLVLLDLLHFLVGYGFEFYVLIDQQALSRLGESRVEPRNQILLGWRL